jgi:hypothetical protein
VSARRCNGSASKVLQGPRLDCGIVVCLEGVVRHRSLRAHLPCVIRTTALMADTCLNHARDLHRLSFSPLRCARCGINPIAACSVRLALKHILFSHTSLCLIE